VVSFIESGQPKPDVIFMSQTREICTGFPPLHDRDHICGSSDAPVLLMEYGDYGCSRSGQSYLVIQQLQAQLGDRLSLIYRHFPLTDQHPQAQKAAETAEAAAAQNQFWQMHDLLCQNSAALTDANLVEYAIQLHLDMPRFLKELSTHVHQERIQMDICSGQQFGVTETPAFFISIRCSSNQNLESLIQAILQAIA